jgi:hypothetical protein
MDNIAKRQSAKIRPKGAHFITRNEKITISRLAMRTAMSNCMFQITVYTHHRL